MDDQHSGAQLQELRELRSEVRRLRRNHEFLVFCVVLALMIIVRFGRMDSEGCAIVMGIAVLVSMQSAGVGSWISQWWHRLLPEKPAKLIITRTSSHS